MSRKPKVAEFKPNTSYSWDPAEKFILTGMEIDKINKALAAAASGPEFQKNAVIYEGLLAFNQFFKQAVESGDIKAIPTDTEESPDYRTKESENYKGSEEYKGEEAIVLEEIPKKTE